MLDNKYQAFFTQSTVGMVCLDQFGYLQDVNPAFCALMGYTAAELLHSPLHQWLHPMDGLAYQATYAKLVAGLIPAIDVEQRLLTRRGQSHWVRMHLAQLHHATDVQPMLFAATLEDIHDRKRLEMDLRRQAQRERLLADFAQQMMRSLDLTQILQSSVEAVYRHLLVDRVVVYRFMETGALTVPAEPPAIAPRAAPGGTVIVEAVGAAWPPMLSRHIRLVGK